MEERQLTQLYRKGKVCSSVAKGMFAALSQKGMFAAQPEGSKGGTACSNPAWKDGRKEGRKKGRNEGRWIISQTKAEAVDVLVGAGTLFSSKVTPGSRHTMWE
jgi:hypothetical protein